MNAPAETKVKTETPIVTTIGKLKDLQKRFGIVSEKGSLTVSTTTTTAGDHLQSVKKQLALLYKEESIDEGRLYHLLREKRKVGSMIESQEIEILAAKPKMSELSKALFDLFLAVDNDEKYIIFNFIKNVFSSKGLFPEIGRIWEESTKAVFIK